MISGMVIIQLCGMAFAYQAYKLYSECTIKAAKQTYVRFILLYLPIVQLAVLFGK